MSDPVVQFREKLPWVAKWFEPAQVAAIAFEGDEKTVAQEISQHWAEQNPIALLDALYEKYGETVGKVLERIIAENVREEWAAVGQQVQSRTLDTFIRLLWNPLKEQGFEFTSEQRPDGLQMHCTNCPHVELAKQLNGERWMYYFLCGTDPHMAAGFLPDIGFRRTKTLMQGDDYCNHFYYLHSQQG